MSSSKFPPIAVIADAHFHDLYGDYDFAGIDMGGPQNDSAPADRHGAFYPGVQRKL